MTASASPARPDQPDWMDPELATLTRDRFSDPAWIFERKLDGERCLAFRSGGPVRLMTRNQKDDTSTYPELTQALGAQRAGDFIIDGEIVAFEGSQTRFARLQQRLGVRQPGPDLLAAVPAWFYIFDVLWSWLVVGWYGLQRAGRGQRPGGVPGGVSRPGARVHGGQ